MAPAVMSSVSTNRAWLPSENRLDDTRHRRRKCHCWLDAGAHPRADDNLGCRVLAAADGVSGCAGLQARCQQRRSRGFAVGHQRAGGCVLERCVLESAYRRPHGTAFAGLLWCSCADGCGRLFPRSPGAGAGRAVLGLGGTVVMGSLAGAVSAAMVVRAFKPDPKPRDAVGFLQAPAAARCDSGSRASMPRE